MRPELEAASLSRATPSVLRGTAIIVASVVIGGMIGIHNSVDGNFVFHSGVGIVLLLLIPIFVIVLTLRIKRQANAAIRTRFASYQVTLDSSGIVRSLDGYTDLTMRWDEVRRVVDRGANGLVLSPSDPENSVILFSELENYEAAKEFALARTPAPSASIYTANYFLRVGLAIVFVAVVFFGLLSHVRAVVGACLVAVIVYAVYGIRSMSGPNINQSLRLRSRIFFFAFPIFLLLRLIFL